MAISEEKSRQIQDERRRQILDAALRLFDEQGYSNTKISDISEKAGISKGLVYRYFRSKEEIFFALRDKLDDCIDECFSVPSALEAIRLFSLRLLSYPYYNEYVPPLRVYFSALVRGEVSLDAEENPIREDFGREYFGSLFKRGQEEGVFKEGDSQLFGDIYWKYLLGCLATMCQPGKQKEFHPDVDEALELFRK